jgi:hypothetical protein
MNQLTWKLILPLTVISFATITKWWYAFPIDAPDTMYSGFPLPFIGDGWHTSMSLQIFILELFVDFLTYFLFWFLLVFCINKYLAQIKTYKVVTTVLWAISGIIILGTSYTASFPEHIFFLKRPYDMEIMETGYKCVWQETKRPDYYKYHAKDTKE